MVLKDIEDNKRQKKSVILMAGGWQEEGTDTGTYEKLKNSKVMHDWYGNGLRAILNIGVPIVCAAGNYANQQGRENIDTVPPLFQDEDTPLINVGAADYEGKRLAMSQGGNQVTIYAPGLDIVIPRKNDFETELQSGTSVGE